MTAFSWKDWVKSQNPSQHSRLRTENRTHCFLNVKQQHWNHYVSRAEPGDGQRVGFDRYNPGFESRSVLCCQLQVGRLPVQGASPTVLTSGIGSHQPLPTDRGRKPVPYSTATATNINTAPDTKRWVISKAVATQIRKLCRNKNCFSCSLVLRTQNVDGQLWHCVCPSLHLFHLRNC
jgi:hypothetical protein